MLVCRCPTAARRRERVPKRRNQTSARRRWPLERVEGETVLIGGGLEIRSDTGTRHADGGTERVRRSEGFDHGRGEPPALGSMALLKLSHRPRELAEAQHLDVSRRGHQLRDEPRLFPGGKRSHGSRELPDTLGCGPGAAEPEPSKPGCGKRRRDTAKVGWSLPSEDVPQHMVVNDRLRHLRGREVRILDLGNVAAELIG